MHDHDHDHDHDTAPTLLIRHARLLVTMDDARREIEDGAVFVRGNAIEAVGTTAELPQQADEVIDAHDQLVIPGLVNTHHHMYQSLTRALPAAQDRELFGWLRALYPVWAGLTPEMAHVSTQTAMAELLLSGATTSSDHLYLYPNGTRLDDCLEAAREIGMRFHAARGSMSVGESQGGLPPDRVVEPEDAILADTQRVIERWHDASRFAMQRIVVAPCSPFSVSRGLMRDAAVLARQHGVSLHTHLAENDNDIAYTREKFGCTPAEYAEELGWLGRDVWCAHCVKLDEAGIRLFARTGTGVAHCPCSNMRLASGIAPIRAMRDAGVPVAIGVDGSASNDSGHMLAEVRQAMLLQRVAYGADKGPSAMGAREVLEIATRGGAQVLNRDDIGQLAPGMAADIVTLPLTGIGVAGALHDPLAALVFGHVPSVRHSIVNGRVVVRDGELTTVDLPRLVERHNRLARQLAEAA
ncbi:8-oxoguanine deaminase [Piscinibacter sp. HJYY11]|uniref:8-oxoguanine deaminase n=1 Tax=Piscinibacter sp. HJYY11 TaxID=2801333 RepID=UPI00191CEFF0|nr:8-oxoguanine deaminase [Piscinibacter sp. HJYY11]MBL0728774.1 8-oxoguanine deaminase [Piscinibacter sp. HJYY11]